MADYRQHYGAHGRAAGSQRSCDLRNSRAATKACADSWPRIEPPTGEEVWRFWTVPRRASRASKPGKARASNRLRRRNVAHRLLRSRARTCCSGPPAIPARFLSATSARATTCMPTRVLALEPETGKLKWHFQFTPHDLHDWDAPKPRAGRCRLRRPAAQAASARQPERFLLRARPRHRRVPQRLAVCRTAHLGERHRQGRPPRAPARRGAEARRGRARVPR